MSANEFVDTLGGSSGGRICGGRDVGGGGHLIFTVLLSAPVFGVEAFVDLFVKPLSRLTSTRFHYRIVNMYRDCDSPLRLIVYRY